MREMDFKMERPGLLEEGQEVTVTEGFFVWPSYLQEDFESVTFPFLIFREFFFTDASFIVTPPLIPGERHISVIWPPGTVDTIPCAKTGMIETCARKRRINTAAFNLTRMGAPHVPAPLLTWPMFRNLFISLTSSSPET